MIHRPTVTHESVKLLEENHCNFCWAKDTTLVSPIKEKNWYFRFHQNKKFPLLKWQGKPQTWRKTLAKCKSSNKGLICRIYKEPWKFNNEKRKDPINEEKMWTNTSHTHTTHMGVWYISTLKDVQPH